MRKSKFLVLLVLFCNPLFGQVDFMKSDSLRQEALGLLMSKEYRKSAEKYKELLKDYEGYINKSDWYNTACCYALVGDVEKSFYHLLVLVEKNYKGYNHITTDSDLAILHSDKRWNDLISKIKANKEEAEKYYDKPLIAILDSIREEDQKYRRQMDEMRKEHGTDSEEWEVLIQNLQEADSLNFLKVSKILDERGWLGTSVIGEAGSVTLWLVIQHADQLPEKQRDYLKFLRVAAEKGEASLSNLAYLEDRVAKNFGNKQVYGTQITQDSISGEFYPYPMIDPENVDKRRMKVGVEPMGSYLEFWGATWDVDKYKKRMAELDAEKED
ncbi:DUF6624 domain-containing protein [Flammeovirgaceae bacterium SG7u.111]|nr:DUF6624 domain-containing protein [Flammeovirgaceae bacterium SG7u.132]WPO36978.1 DUF6624 domain-containing protein [Flammeovirgaceae bacterium SG7u.111]